MGTSPCPIAGHRLGPALLRRLEGICLQRWGRMQEQLRLCYPNIQLQPPLAELKQIFKAAAKAG